MEFLFDCFLCLALDLFYIDFLPYFLLLDFDLEEDSLLERWDLLDWGSKLLAAIIYNMDIMLLLLLGLLLFYLFELWLWTYVNYGRYCVKKPLVYF